MRGPQGSSGILKGYWWGSGIFRRFLKDSEGALKLLKGLRGSQVYSGVVRGF